MHPLHSSALLLSLLLAPVPSLANLRCDAMVANEHKFDLSKLGGPHSVVTSYYESEAETHINTTYTVDICNGLKREKGEKGCPGSNTRVCGIRHVIGGEDEDTISNVFAIAGNLENYGGSQFDYKLTRLKTSDSHSDSDKVGVRLVMNGGKHPLSGPVKERRAQKAVIEFICDPNKTGTEGEWGAEDKYDSKLRHRADDGDDKGGDDKDGEKDGDEDGGEKDGDGDGDDDAGESGKEHQLQNDDSSLIWKSYESEKDADVLRMTWYTKYACEERDDSDDEDDGNSSTHWGFFTWFIIVVFLGTASYLIFGSWLNYNRYGARGWDLVPHGDTIRDIPYLMKDWLRRVLNTVQGAGSRGGYSAV